MYFHERNFGCCVESVLMYWPERFLSAAHIHQVILMEKEAALKYHESMHATHRENGRASVHHVRKTCISY